jgi:hypothetical protein
MVLVVTTDIWKISLVNMVVLPQKSVFLHISLLSFLATQVGATSPIPHISRHHLRQAPSNESIEEQAIRILEETPLIGTLLYNQHYPQYKLTVSETATLISHTFCAGTTTTIYTPTISQVLS